MTAFERFEEIQKLNNTQDKHRAWLKDYENIPYSIAIDQIHQMKWKTEPKKYKDAIWDPKINCIGRRKDRTIIEFDGDEKEAKRFSEKVKQTLKDFNWGFIETTHFGKCNYLWVEFDRDLSDKEVKKFLEWIAPSESVIDLNFASSEKVFAVMYGIHWKHSYHREMPVDFFKGEKINFDSLNIKDVTRGSTKRITKSDGFQYDSFTKFGQLPVLQYSIEGEVSEEFKQAAQVFTGKIELARKFIQTQPIYYDNAGLWWLWNHKRTCWEITDELNIVNFLYFSLGVDTINSKERMEIIQALKQIARIQAPQEIPVTWIQFKDTIVDIKTGTEIKASPKYFCMNPIPYSLDPQKCVLTPTMDKIFGEWGGGKKTY